MNVELEILDGIQMYLRCGILDTVMPLLTALGNHGFLWIVSTIALLLVPKTRRLGMAAAAALVLESLCCNILLKPLIARPRPFDVNTAVQLLIERPTDFSFPSGHTGAAFAVVSALYFGKSRIWIPAFILASLIGFSRLYLYVHYPTDVLAGLLLGMAAGWCGSQLVKSLGRGQAHNL